MMPWLNVRRIIGLKPSYSNTDVLVLLQLKAPLSILFLCLSVVVLHRADCNGTFQRYLHECSGLLATGIQPNSNNVII